MVPDMHREDAQRLLENESGLRRVAAAKSRALRILRRIRNIFNIFSSCYTDSEF